LAHHLERLILLLSLSLVASGQGFSHQQALAGMDAKQQAAACLQCHPAMKQTKPRAGSALQGFNHELHLKLGPIGLRIAQAVEKRRYLGNRPPDAALLKEAASCTACHRGLQTAAVTSKANFPHMADCLVCHSQIEVPYSCEKCHAANVALKPVNHSADFLDAHTTGKLSLDKTSCAVCHGRSFTCQGCH
jgi:hypothetical protein